MAHVWGRCGDDDHQPDVNLRFPSVEINQSTRDCLHPDARKRCSTTPPPICLHFCSFDLWRLFRMKFSSSAATCVATVAAAVYTPSSSSLPTPTTIESSSAVCVHTSSRSLAQSRLAPLSTRSTTGISLALFLVPLCVKNRRSVFFRPHFPPPAQPPTLVLGFSLSGKCNQIKFTVCACLLYNHFCKILPKNMPFPLSSSAFAAGMLVLLGSTRDATGLALCLALCLSLFFKHNCRSFFVVFRFDCTTGRPVILPTF